MKVADFVINRLADEGIKDIFVVYGAANGDLIDAFTRTDKTRYVAVQHEQGGGFALEGYAKVSGKPGAAIATSGPGGMNFVTPIGNCYYDSVPGIFITGNVKSKYQKDDKNPLIRQVGFQETDIAEIVKPITNYSKMITDPNRIRYELEKAIFLSQHPRPGPVLLDLPIDIQKAEISPESLQGFDAESALPKYDEEKINMQVDKFLEDLLQSKRPAMFIGGGVRTSGGIEKLLEVGEILKIPMFPTWNALDAVTDDNPYFGGRVGTYGGKGRNFGIQNSDLLLAVGSRVSGRITGSRIKDFARDAKKYLVNVDEPFLAASKKRYQNSEEKSKYVLFDECIHSDAKLFLEKLAEKLKSVNVPDFSNWMSKVAEWRDRYDPVKPEYYEQKEIVHPYVFFRTLSQEMRSGDILIGDCGGNIVASNHAFETKKGQHNISNNGNSPMGFSFAGAMGAYLASDKKHNVVCTIGDGGFTMNSQELQTVKNYNLAFKTFIVNNQVYGITKAFQERNFEGRMEACGPKGYSPPDFVDVCNAYGIKTFEIKDHSELRDRIKEVLAYEGPAVCNVNCYEYHTYQPNVSGAVPIEDMHPLLPREEFIKNMIISPLPGWDNKIPYKQ